MKYTYDKNIFTRNFILFYIIFPIYVKKSDYEINQKYFYACEDNTETKDNNINVMLISKCSVKNVGILLFTFEWILNNFILILY